ADRAARQCGLEEAMGKIWDAVFEVVTVLTGSERGHLKCTTVATGETDQLLDGLGIFTLLLGEVVGAIQKGTRPVIKHHDLGSLSVEILRPVSLDESPPQLQQAP